MGSSAANGSSNRSRIWIEHQGADEADALPLTAAQLERITREVLGGDADERRELGQSFAHMLSRPASVPRDDRRAFAGSEVGKRPPSCTTYPIRRRRASHDAGSRTRPRTTIRPEVGRARPSTRRSSVDLPAPLPPTSARRAPVETSRVVGARTVRAPTRSSTSSSRSIAFLHRAEHGGARAARGARHGPTVVISTHGHAAPLSGAALRGTGTTASHDRPLHRSVSRPDEGKNTGQDPSTWR